jgi:hypothetical protein
LLSLLDIFRRISMEYLPAPNVKAPGAAEICLPGYPDAASSSAARETVPEL